jgi:hypothetical protein
VRRDGSSVNVIYEMIMTIILDITTARKKRMTTNRRCCDDANGGRGHVGKLGERLDGGDALELGLLRVHRRHVEITFFVPF